MGFLADAFEPFVAGGPHPADDFWYSPSAPGSTAAGIRVTPSVALQVSTVYACVRVIAETLGSLPLLVYERLAGGGKERATQNPLWELFTVAPNEWQTPMEFIEMLQGHALLRGEGAALIVPGPRGPVDSLVPLHPDKWEALWDEDTQMPVYQVKDMTGAKVELFRADEIFHLRGYSWGGVSAIAPIWAMADSIGLAKAVERYGAQFFGQFAAPRGVLQTDNALSDTAYERLHKGWRRDFEGIANSHGTAILEEGLKWQAISMNNNDSQFLETRKFTVAEIARWFRVPPHMVGDLERATFSNIEQQAIEFVTHTIRPWAERWEQAITRDLIVSPDRFFAEFLLDGLLRGDQEARAMFYRTLWEIGALSPNEIRQLENRNPREGGDEFRVAANTDPSGGGTTTVPGRSRRRPAAPGEDQEGDQGGRGRRRALSLALLPPPDRAGHDQTAAQRTAANMALIAADRVLRAEVGHVVKWGRIHAKDSDAFKAKLREFYEGRHLAMVQNALGVTEETARHWCQLQLGELSGGGVVVVSEAWAGERAKDLADMALSEGDGPDGLVYA